MDELFLAVGALAFLVAMLGWAFASEGEDTFLNVASDITQTMDGDWRYVGSRAGRLRLK